MTSPTQKTEREEALEAARWIITTTEAFPNSHAAKVARALLSSSKAEGEMRKALTQARQELWEALHSHMSEAEFNKEVEYIDAALSPKEVGK
jgi:hypothetical protein